MLGRQKRKQADVAHKNAVFADPHCVWPCAGSAVPAGAKQSDPAKATEPRKQPSGESNRTRKQGPPKSDFALCAKSPQRRQLSKLKKQENPIKKEK